MLVELAKVKRSNLRKKFSEPELRLLGKSLRVRQLQPIVMLEDWTLLAGERRVRAAILEGLTHLDAVVITDPVDEARIRAFQFAENVQRADFTPIELCAGACQIAADHPGLTQRHLPQGPGYCNALACIWEGDRAGSEGS